MVSARLGLDHSLGVVVPQHHRDDDPTAANPLGVLTDDTRLRFLAVAATDPQAMVDLRQGELRWAAGHLHGGAGSGFGPAGIGLVANVDAPV